MSAYSIARCLKSFGGSLGRTNGAGAEGRQPLMLHPEAEGMQ
jgi:hypothetical protein